MGWYYNTPKPLKIVRYGLKLHASSSFSIFFLWESISWKFLILKVLFNITCNILIYWERNLFLRVKIHLRIIVQFRSLSLHFQIKFYIVLFNLPRLIFLDNILIYLIVKLWKLIIKWSLILWIKIFGIHRILDLVLFEIIL